MGKKKTVKQSSPLIDRLPKNEKEYIKKLIYLTERNITDIDSEMNQFFKQQAQKLKNKLKELK